ncbi:MAG: hypothetical protein JW795_18795 [Chitinivibrionales bacterium]|nr:hypothetical protein [Chitinivibrionales bacterium]
MTAKPALDICVICVLVIISSVVLSALGGMGLTGIAEIAEYDERKVFFGLVVVGSEISWAIYLFLKGLWELIAGIGTLRLHNWAKNLMIVFLINATIDVVFVIPTFLISSIIIVVIQISLIFWLIFRGTEFKEKE